MDLHQLRLLRELGDRGSVAAVARAFYVTPSAVSQQLAALQRTTPVPLTRRQGRTLVLTDAGHALAQAAVEVATAMAAAEHAVTRYVKDPAAPVSVAAFHSAGLAYFPGLLQAMAAAEEAPVVSCHDRDVAQEDFPALTADFDLVIAHRLEHTRPWPGTVQVVPLVREPLDVAVAAHHRLAHQTHVSPADLVGEHWVSVHEGFPLDQALHLLGAATAQPVDVTHRINEFFVTSAVVATGQAIALMPRYTTVAPADAHIVLIPLTGLSLTRNIDVLARPEALHRTATRTVLTALQDSAGSPEDRTPPQTATER
ncbi:LysR family transcriptional regulator [Kocuria sp. SM24M-10]|uniref:LysR family transcriptional regulator n=1 Tax=Kocuria sp. SM24M-10 TaxID=1660349 RepID=UPI00064B2D0C|nr:LysR family transcriptional regulator [Kocuria sp. SM24M-10]KLU09782.1 hypothetical protein ABL57_10490 [Kocuria sp. SM24M-10]